MQGAARRMEVERLYFIRLIPLKAGSVSEDLFLRIKKIFGHYPFDFLAEA